MQAYGLHISPLYLGYLQQSLSPGPLQFTSGQFLAQEPPWNSLGLYVIRVEFKVGINIWLGTSCHTSQVNFSVATARNRMWYVQRSSAWVWKLAMENSQTCCSKIYYLPHSITRQEEHIRGVMCLWIKGLATCYIWIFQMTKKSYFDVFVSNRLKSSNINKAATHAGTCVRTWEEDMDTKLYVWRKKWTELQAELWWRVDCECQLPWNTWCSICRSNFSHTILPFFIPPNTPSEIFWVKYFVFI